jgi:hypothetical protein
MLFLEHDVKMFECSEVATVKGDKDRHHLAGSEPPSTISVSLASGQLTLTHKGLHNSTIVVHITKQRFPIHGILSSLAALPIMTWGEYLFSRIIVIPNSGWKAE